MEELEIVIEKETDSEQLINVLEEEIREIHPDYEQLTVTPSTETQTKDGTFNKVTVVGDSDLIPENIKEGTNIFGVVGTAKVQSESEYITDGTYLFYNGSRLSAFNSLINMCKDLIGCSNMFSGCGTLEGELDLSKLDTRLVTTTYSMFYFCSNIESINMSTWNTESLSDMASMFYGCTTLKSLDVSNFNTAKVTRISSIFYNVRVSDLDLRNWDLSNVSACSNAFTSCKNLVNLISFNNLGKGFKRASANFNDYTLTLSSSPLSYDSLIDVMTNGLYDLNLTYNVANGGTLYTQKLVLGSTNTAKLTAEEIAIATAKGWTVS